MRVLLIAFVTCIACKNSTQTNQKTSTDSSSTILEKIFSDQNTLDNNIWVDRLNGQTYPLPDSIAGKPVSFYLNNPKVKPIAKALYSGQFRPTDNDSTTELLTNVTTNDSILRPFYRWCLDFTISISDGALAEYPGKPALKYALEFPKEFLNYMNKDTSGRRFANWTGIIAYSGLEDYNRNKFEFEKEIVSKMLSKCPSCEEEEKNQIKKFAKEITASVKLQD